VMGADITAGKVGTGLHKDYRALSDDERMHLGAGDLRWKTFQRQRPPVVAEIRCRRNGRLALTGVSQQTRPSLGGCKQ